MIRTTGRIRYHSPRLPRAGKLTPALSALRGLHGEAFSRAAGDAARLQARLHGDPAVAAIGGADEAGAATLGASQEAAAPAAGGDDAAPGRLALCLAGGQ